MSWLRRAIMWPSAVRTAARELQDANEVLHERYNQLEEAREKVQRQATQLKVAYDISRLIHANLDLDSTLEAIASSLVTIAGFAAAALSLDTFSEHEPVKRAVKTGVELPDFARVMRTSDSHGVKFGEVNLWIPPGSDLRAAEDLLDYVIPIILLTARAGTENRIEGLQKGADDYVIKPFVARELLARVKNLIALRETLRKRFSSERLLKSVELLVPSMDQVFLQKAMEIVDRHMSDEGFGINDFSREIGLSRTQLHRKLVALTDCSARDFLRRLRLERGSDLLHKNAGSVSEIAYQVGFRDPSHFAKCFGKQFGVPPGAVRPPASTGH